MAPNGPTPPPWVRRALWTVLLFVVMMWVGSFGSAILLCFWIGRLNLAVPCAILGLGLTTACAILWIGDVTGIIPLRKSISDRLWKSLIAVVIGATAAQIAACVRYGGVVSADVEQVRISSCQLLEENLLPYATAKKPVQPDVRVRLTPTYDGVRAPIAFAAVISGFTYDKENKFNLSYTVSLENKEGLAETERWDPSPMTMKQLRAEQNQRIVAHFGKEGEKILNAVFPHKENEIVRIFLLKDRKELGMGSFRLYLTVTDDLTHSTDTHYVNVEIKAAQDVLFAPEPTRTETTPTSRTAEPAFL